jgi:hypothetical protein
MGLSESFRGKEVSVRENECIKVKATAEHLPPQAAAIPARRFAPPPDIVPQLGAGDNLGSKPNFNSDIYSEARQLQEVKER